MKRQVESFVAHAKDGHAVEICVLQSFLDVTAVGDRSRQWEPGLKELRTADGHAVNRLDQGKYEIVGSGVQLSCDDPQAP